MMETIRLNSSDLAILAGISTRKARAALQLGIQGLPWRGSELDVQWQHGRGGQEMAVSLSTLPKDLQIEWAKRNLQQTPPENPPELYTEPRGSRTARQDKSGNPFETEQKPRKHTDTDVEQMEAVWQKKTDRQKKKGQRRAKALFAVEKLQADGLTKSDAVKAVAQQQKVTEASIWNWFGKVSLWPRDAWQMILTDNYNGKQKSIEIDEEAWEYILADYLRLEAPALSAVYDRAAQRFELPSIKTVQRRINELPNTESL